MQEFHQLPVPSYPVVEYDNNVPTDNGVVSGWWVVFGSYDYELLDHEPSETEIQAMLNQRQ